VNAFEVEEKLLRHPDVVTVVAFAIPSLLGDGTEDETKFAVVAREDSITERDFNERDL
jgi:non-ribosomal peptide synthetase component E (peptide arylation enzyme)